MTSRSLTDRRVFIDPRTNPDAASPRPAARLTSDVSELAELHRLCRDGRIYDVERWIQEGKPLQLAPGTPLRPRSRYRTALEIAFDRPDYSLILLLVVNGYDWSLERLNPLDEALRQRRRDLLDLFLDWGADPLEVDVHTLCETYETELFERFRGLGVDFTADHALAYALGYHTSNKPLFGFAKRHRESDPKIQYDLDIALAYHASEGNEKGVMLCLWAGADPHAKVPSLRWGLSDDDVEEDRDSAVAEACSSGHTEILERLGPNPSLDDYEELYLWARNPETIELLARSALPREPSTVIARQVRRACWDSGFFRRRPLQTLEALFALGLGWNDGSKEEIADVRRLLLKAHDWTFERLMKLLGESNHCSLEILTELARTAAMRQKMRKVGLIPEGPRGRSAFDRRRPRQARKTLERFGIEKKESKSQKQKEPPAYLPRHVRIGRRSRDGEDLVLSRTELFDRVWSTPVSVLVKEWNISDRGLGKACARLRIPTPPRGYWAKRQAGQRVRRPKLPKLPEGQAEEIVIGVIRTDKEV